MMTPIVPRNAQPSRMVTLGPDVHAVVFDLDGVLTDTARVHEAVWKVVFDDYLRRRAEREGQTFRPFTHSEYRAHVDGRPRLDGIRSFLAARGVQLREGSPSDSENAETVRGVARRKNRLMQERLKHPPVPEPGAVALLEALRRKRVRIAVASSSANCATVLKAACLDGLVDVRVDGIDAAKFCLPGKPDPALFLEALRRLGVPPDRSALFEDALAGVEAGRRAGFGWVIGVDRGGQANALRRHGAREVIANLTNVGVS